MSTLIPRDPPADAPLADLVDGLETAAAAAASDSTLEHTTGARPPAHLTELDHEGFNVTLAANGDASRYGVFLSTQGAGVDITAHLTPAAMRRIAVWLHAQLGGA